MLSWREPSRFCHVLASLGVGDHRVHICLALCGQIILEQFKIFSCNIIVKGEITERILLPLGCDGPYWSDVNPNSLDTIVKNNIPWLSMNQGLAKPRPITLVSIQFQTDVDLVRFDLNDLRRSTISQESMTRSSR